MEAHKNPSLVHPNSNCGSSKWRNRFGNLDGAIDISQGKKAVEGEGGSWRTAAHVRTATRHATRNHGERLGLIQSSHFSI